MDLRRKQLKNRLMYFLETEDECIRAQLETSNIADGIVECLLDGTVYEIVKSLKDLQWLREAEIVNNRNSQLASITDTNDVEEITKNLDLKILETLDEIVKEQQSTLSCTGMPMFKVSDQANDIKLQMAIINFILSLSDVYANDNDGSDSVVK
uniref:Uncharacterized protein n=1 Tax=Ditylenchus dipsaci TaxID=166011 RepID=A0A915CVG5_9BILA